MAVRFERMWGLGLHWAWLPLITFLMALSVIVTLMVLWLTDGHPRYRTDEDTVVYISDVGAAHHTVFMVLGIITAVLFFITILFDFHLRHTHRIPVRLRKRERFFSAVATIFAFFTAVFCILLTIFDAFNHDNLHWAFAATFFVCLIVSGVANLCEIACLSRDYRKDPLLRASFIIKLIIIVLGISALISIGALAAYCNHKTPPGVETNLVCNRPASGEAALEWFLATCFAFYILSIVLDMYPSRYTSKHVSRPAGPALTQMISNQTYGNVDEKHMSNGGEEHGASADATGVPKGSNGVHPHDVV